MEITTLPPGEKLDTLSACLLIEESCAKIYRYFASVFSDNQEVAGIWSELAAEEDRHAETFRQVIDAHGRESRGSGDDNFLARAILDKLDSFMAGMKLNPPKPDEAFLSAAILEHSIEKYHVEVSKSLVHPELSELLSTMADYDRCHREIMQRGR